MYKYEEPSMFSGKRGVAFGIVILLHIVVGYGFYTGLAQHFIAKVIPPVEVTEIEKPKVDDKPPPPPPKIEMPKVYVPPPEFVPVQEPQAEPPVVMQTTSNPTPAPVVVAAPPAPVAIAGTPARLDPRHPVNVDDYYPDSSKRANEEGRCVAKISVGTDGRASNPEIVTGTGFSRLDEACLKIAKTLRLIPATENGKPVPGSLTVPVVFKFKQ